MGYTTEFKGSFNLSIPATREQIQYINTFSGTRRMKRNPAILMELYKGEHGLPGADKSNYMEVYGNDGAFFCKEDGDYGQTSDSSIIDYNTSPGLLSYRDNKYSYEKNEKLIERGDVQPGLWCQWVLVEGGAELEWNGAEKFYYYIEWLKYLIKYFFEPWGIKLNGIVKWRGESFDDLGKITISDNIVSVEYIKF